MPTKTQTEIEIPENVDALNLKIENHSVALTNLSKHFWPKRQITKRHLLQYYASVAGTLLPHVMDRAMVMKRYPNGIEGKFFFMKRAPEPRPAWIETCPILHASGSLIHFPIVQDLASLLWLINLGCIDLNPWYATCDDVNRPDYLHFDLDPVPPASFEEVRGAALRVREYLEEIKLRVYPKTSGSRGIHLYVPIRRGPLQKQVWTIAKKIAGEIAGQYPELLTSEYQIKKRPAKHVLIDYNQNAWGRTLASVYSVRPTENATVSAPLSWKELSDGAEPADFTLMNMPARIRRVGDLFDPLLDRYKRCDLTPYL